MREILTILFVGLFSRKMLLLVCLFLASVIAYIFFYTDTFKPSSKIEIQTPTQDKNQSLTSEEIIQERASLPVTTLNNHNEEETTKVDDLLAITFKERAEITDPSVTEADIILAEQEEQESEQVTIENEKDDVSAITGTGLQVGTTEIVDELTLQPPIDVEVSGTVINVSPEDAQILIQNETSVLVISLEESTVIILAGKKIALSDLEIFDVLTITGTSHPYSSEVTAQSITLTSKFEPVFKNES